MWLDAKQHCEIGPGEDDVNLIANRGVLLVFAFELGLGDYLESKNIILGPGGMTKPIAALVVVTVRG